MPSGSCLCGALQTSLSGSVETVARCHCTDCRRISGSAFSTNLFVHASDLTLTSGQPKQYTKSTDAGNEITSFFCENCGSTLWRESTGMKGFKIVKAGTMGDMVESDPTLELYADRRPEGIGAIPGAKQEMSTS